MGPVRPRVKISVVDQGSVPLKMPWDPATIDRRLWMRAGVTGALARGRVLVVGRPGLELPLTAAAFGHDVVCILGEPHSVDVGNAAAASLLLPCRFGPTDGPRLPFQTASFGSVILADCFDDSTAPATMMDEAVRVCAPNGHLLVTVPNAAHPQTGASAGASTVGALTTLLSSHVPGPLRWSRWMLKRWLLAWLPLSVAWCSDRTAADAPVTGGSLELDPRDPAAHRAIVSVVVPTFNRAHLLRRTLDSVYRQTYQNLEVIVVDDGSTDGTRSVVERHPAKPRYVRKPNGGKSSALNAGLPLATGEYLWIADDDDLALPHKLVQQVQVLNRNPDAAIAYSAAYDFQGAPRNIVDYRPAPEYGPDHQLAKVLDLGLVTGGGALYRTSALRAMAPFDEALVRSQDLDMWIRLARRYPLARVSFPGMLYRRHSGLRGTAADRFPPEQNEARWLAHDSRIYRKVYSGMALSELDPLLGDGSTPDRLAAALVFRSKLMLRRGLVAEAAADARLARHYLGRAPSQAPDLQRRLLADALDLAILSIDRPCRDARRAALATFRHLSAQDVTLLEDVMTRLTEAAAASPAQRSTRVLRLASLQLVLLARRPTANTLSATFRSLRIACRTVLARPLTGVFNG